MNNFKYGLIVSTAMLLPTLSSAEQLFSGALQSNEQEINWGGLLYLTSNEDAFAGGGGGHNLAEMMVSSEKANEPSFEPPAFSYNKMHQYMGLSTLALVTLSAVLPKDGGLHKHTATLAAASAAATAGGGLFVHWNDFDMSEGLTEPDNLHVMFAGLGALAVIAAAASAPNDDHIGLGIAGGLSIGAAVKLTW